MRHYNPKSFRPYYLATAPHNPSDSGYEIRPFSSILIFLFSSLPFFSSFFFPFSILLWLHYKFLKWMYKNTKVWSDFIFYLPPSFLVCDRLPRCFFSCPQRSDAERQAKIAKVQGIANVTREVAVHELNFAYGNPNLAIENIFTSAAGKQRTAQHPLPLFNPPFSEIMHCSRAPCCSLAPE